MSARVTYPDTFNRQADSSKITLDKILQAINAGGGGGGGAAQMYEYTGTDPTSDGITPASQDQPAIAYKRTGDAPLYSWNTVAHTWG